MSIPYLPLFVTDYEADTAHLTIAEDGAYTRLLRLQWRTPGCSLPDDTAWIQRRVRASDEEWATLFQPMLEEFFSRNRGRLYQARLRKEFERINVTSAKRSSAGKKGGRPRKPLKTNETGKSPAKANGKHLELELDIEKEGTVVPSKKRRKTSLPEEAVANDRNLAAASKRGLSEIAAQEEFERFKNHHLAKGSTFTDWDRAWLTWLDSPYRKPISQKTGGPNDRFAAAMADAERASQRTEARHGMADCPGDVVPGPLFPAERKRGGIQDADGGLARGFGRPAAGGDREGNGGAQTIDGSYQADPWRDTESGAVLHFAGRAANF